MSSATHYFAILVVIRIIIFNSCIIEGCVRRTFWPLLKYREIHTVFHIAPVTAQGSNISHRAEGPKDDVGRGLIQVAIWKIVCIISFITYFVLTYPRRFLYLNTIRT